MWDGIINFTAISFSCITWQGFIEKGKKMTSLTLGLIMAVCFALIFISQIFALQKEVRKLKSITSRLMKEINKIKGKNGK